MFKNIKWASLKNEILKPSNELLTNKRKFKFSKIKDRKQLQNFQVHQNRQNKSKLREYMSNSSEKDKLAHMILVIPQSTHFKI